jgi:hypothetical protein
MLTEGEPADTVRLIENVDVWMASSPPIPKLLLILDSADGSLMIGWARENISSLEIEACGPAAHACRRNSHWQVLEPLPPGLTNIGSSSSKACIGSSGDISGSQRSSTALQNTWAVIAERNGVLFRTNPSYPYDAIKGALRSGGQNWL